MQKVYLKYDDNNNNTHVMECEWGFVKEMIYLGFLYPIKKQNYKMYYIMLMVQVAISVLIMMFIPFKIGIICVILMILMINTLFAANYNSIVIEELLKKGYRPMDYNTSELLIRKGIYFELK